MDQDSKVLNIFGELLASVIKRTPLANDRPLRWTIIVNPKAGGFTINRRWKKHLLSLNSILQSVSGIPERYDVLPSDTGKREGGDFGLIATKDRGHAGEIATAVIDDALNYNESVKPFNLLITAGGDGTSLEVLSGLYEARAGLGNDFAVLRLPMGTGNDGADAWELNDALTRLTKPVTIERRRVLSLTTSTPGKGPFLAFNILSAGLDAFVTHMTNKMKGKLPGDSYKLWVDLAALFYDRVYKVGPMEVNATGENGEPAASFNENVLLLAVGESGRRTYGSHKWILPDDRNVCYLRQMSLWRKLALKEMFNTGTHIDKPEATLFNAKRVEFSCVNPILAQMDGETVLLEKEDFPAVIELSEPEIPILKPIPEL